jgi:hypothetical protein
MLDTVRNGVMSATGRMYLTVMIFLRHLLKVPPASYALVAWIFIKAA